MLRHRTFAIASLVIAAACSDDTKQPTPDSGADELADVVYVGEATDEALERLLDVAAKDDPAQYVVIDAPDLSAPLAADTPPTFEYHLASQALHVPAPREAEPAAPAWQRPLREVLKLLGPPRVAYAHGAPLNGTGYFLELDDARGNTVLRVFTDKNSYAPDAATWKSLAQAPQPLTLEITSAFFEDNDIPADGGPFVGGSFELSIE